MAAAMEIEVSADDVAYEEDVLRDPFRLSGWLRYLSARRAAPPAKRAAIYERALRALPGSYKLWHAYLTELGDAARALPVTHAAHAGLDAAFERALAAGMSRMPRVWHMYASSLLHQRLLTRARHVLDRALRSLPVTQHHHVWPLHLRLASLPDCPAPTAVRVHGRHLQFDPDHEEDFIAFLVSAGRWRDAAQHLAAAIDDEGFVSVKGTTKRQLLLDLCGLLAQHPEDVAGMPVDGILRGSIRKFPEEAGVLWTSLASHYARRGLHGKARDVFEEAMTTATTVKDFRMVFDAYLHFEHAMAAAELELCQADAVDVQDCWLADRDSTDLAMARLERLLERRPELLNSVLLRQNPHDVQAWHERAKIFHKDPARHAATYAEAVRTVDPAKATGKPPHTLWLALAKMYEDRGSVGCARDVLHRATQANFTAAEHLAAVYCEWAHMELRHQDPERAIDLIRRATTPPSIEPTTHAAAAGGEDVRVKLHRCLKLWLVYLNLMTTHGSLESTCAVYDKMHDLGVVTPLLVLDHATLLEQHGRFEDAFRVYERGVRSFKHPHADAIWEAYLTKFVQRHGKSRPERVRDLFQAAVLQAPPQRKKAVYLRYARFGEDFGLASRAMKVYVDAASAVPASDRLGVYEVYVARATELYGLLKARDVYQQAIVGGGLPDEGARAMCVGFADLEIVLGEVARARALYAYAAAFTDPKVYPEFWKRRNDFEVLHGDEGTFREMLRMKRTMAAVARDGAGARGEIRTDAGVVEQGLRPCAGQRFDGAQQCKRIRLV
ncbi:pre-mRNA-splicing factor syf1 homolog [Triticum aestivum]|uniref:pre-mRNA-splicing factor syf1 homolog n=1 Tax=Triticum aestivum TaxID=4565 RepID=UPI001D002EC7|nr:pre-mRNA-splicing factor syf1 homolog [Triticum aestivum]